MLGVSFYQRHLRASGRATLDDVIKHLVHLTRAAGGPERVGLGTDLDGGFDAREAPMKDLTELRELRAALAKRFSKTQVDGVMGGNWIEFLGRSLPD
jgi:membrane dipeptidase